MLSADSVAFEAMFEEAIAKVDWDQPLTVGEMQPILLGFSAEAARIDVPTNVDAADTTNTDQLQPGGELGLDLTGAGYTVGVWEAGGGLIRETHQEFGGRVQIADTGGSIDNHATHVAGTIGAAGISADARGMASEVSIRSWTSGNDNAELALDADNLIVSNHSYGFVAGWRVLSDDATFGNVDRWYGDYSVSSIEDADFGRYSSSTAGLDESLHQNPHLLSVWSGGNHRNDAFTNASGDNTYVTFFSQDPGGIGWSGAGVYRVPNAGITAAPASDGNNGSGFDSLSSDQVAKNSLVVGATSDVLSDPYTLSQITTTSFSSYGPTDDGRIKPDLVGNGSSLFSSGADADDDYYFSSGTSMSAPNVAGTAVLLVEHYENLFGERPQASTTKGLLLHTAADAGNFGPDYSYGWGLADAAAAANLLTNVGTTGSAEHFVDELSYGGDILTETLLVDGSSPFKATIVWTDPAGDPELSNTLDSAVRRLVNDLDLWVTDEQGTVYYPWTLDPTAPSESAVRSTRNEIDNVEQVLIDFPAAGEYTVHVGHTGSAFDQDFSVLVSGLDDGVDEPPSVSIDRSLSGSPSPRLSGSVSNPLAEVRVSVGAQTDLLAINNGDGTWTLPAGSLAPLPDGVYDVTARGSVGEADGFDTSAGELTVDTAGDRVVLNPDRIAIPGEGTSGQAAPYGSVINVDSIEGTLQSLRVSLLGFEHTYPNDVQILLAGPNGQTVGLMGRVGGSSPVDGVDLTFDDDAASAISSSTVTTGTYQPSNPSGVTTLPTPAPAGPYGETLSVFAGLPVNGAWRLYINDAAGSDLGALVDGWELDLQIVEPPTITVESLVADQSELNSGNTEFTFRVERAGDLSQPTTIDWSLEGSEGFDAADVLSNNGSLDMLAEESNATITVLVQGDTLVENDESFTLTLDNASFGTIVGATATGVIRNDDFAILSISDATAEEGEQLTFNVTLDSAVPGGPFTVVAFFTSGSAQPSDYGSPVPVGLVFNGSAGETRSFTVDAIDDSETEPTESFQVFLDVINQPIQILGGATGTILDNDPAITPSIASIERLWPSSNPTNLDFVQFLVRFNEPVSRVGTADFLVTGGVQTSIVGTGRTSATGDEYRITVMGGNLAGFDGEVGLGLSPGFEVFGANGQLIPATGPAEGFNQTFTLDNTAPVVSVDDLLSEFGDPQVTGTADGTATRVLVSVAGRPAAEADIDNEEWFFNVDPQLAPGSYPIVALAFDEAGNVGQATGLLTIEAATPTVVSIRRYWPTDDPTNQNSVQFLVEYSQPVKRVGLDDFTVTGGTTATVGGVARLSPLMTRVTVNGGDLLDFDGIVGLRLSDAFSVLDLDNQPLPPTGPIESEIEFFTLDNTLPNYQITRLGTETISGPDAAFRVAFDEPVLGVGPTDFAALPTPGVTTGVLAVEARSAFEYTITVEGVAGEGSLGLALTDPDGVSDQAGNQAGIATLSESYTIFDDTVVVPDVTLLRTVTAPIIDGVPDGLWAGVPLLNLNVNWRGSSDSPEDGSVQWKAIWSDAAIHYLFIVRDEVIYLDSPTDAFNDDGIEIFLDPNFSRGETYDGIDDTKLTLRPLDTIAHPGSRMNHTEDWSQVQYATASNPAGPGYIIEASVPWSVLNDTPAPGKQIGFELGMLDDDDGNAVNLDEGSPDGRLLWRDTSNRAPFRPGAFSTAELSASTISLPAAASAPLELATPVPAAITPIAITTEDLKSSDATATQPALTANPVDGASDLLLATLPTAATMAGSEVERLDEAFATLAPSGEDAEVEEFEFELGDLL